jgi:branched-chain amino acid transport system substrate-binding protein
MKKSSALLGVLLVFALLGSIVCGGCGGAQQTGEKAKEPIKIGVILPMTGSEAMFGEMEKNSFLMAYEELKAAGKTSVNGREIELVFEDDQGKQDVAKAAAERLVNQQKAVMLTGGYTSSCTKVIAGTANALQTPFLVVTGSADDVTRQGWQWVFRGAAAPASKYTGALWDMMDKVIKPKRIALIYENTDFGTSSAKGFRAACQERGISLVFDQAYEKGALDFKPMLANMKKAKPDVVFAVSYVMDAALITKQMKELNFDVNLFIGGGAGYTMPEFKENAETLPNTLCRLLFGYQTFLGRARPNTSTTTSRNTARSLITTARRPTPPCTSSPMP